MKIGNAPLPVTDRIVRQREAPLREREAGPEDGARTDRTVGRREPSRTGEPQAAGAIPTAEDARKLAKATREMIAESNREAAVLHEGLDARKLKDLLA